MDNNLYERANEMLVKQQENFKVVEEEKRPTSIVDIQSYSRGAVIELPPFGPGQPFIARLKRPSLMILVKSGKIPNSLLNQATSLFTQGGGAVDGKQVDMQELIDIFDIIAESALIEPSYNQIKEAGMDLTDDQMSAIFAYVQSGVKTLENFRTE